MRVEWKEIYQTTSKWMKLRTDDENFVIDTILSECETNNSDKLFIAIDANRIGLIGHSLGGATSAQIARLRDDIQAVIVLDGTMLGEEIAFQDNSVFLNDNPYPIPLLNIYAEDHYNNSKASDGENYSNFYASKNALLA